MLPNPVDVDKITLGTDVFTTAFPFHVAFNPDGIVVQVGPSLSKLLPGLRPGEQIDAHLTVKRPDVPLRYAAVARRATSLFLLQSIDQAMLLLNGQMLPIRDPEVVVFLGSPWITDACQLESLGLTLQDFAIHDPIGDYVALLHAQSTALADANRLAEELSALNSTLEVRVAERTKSLAEANDQLTARTLQLEEALDSLRTNEEHLRQSQKMEAIGRLAGGVAHDFNNLLTVILGHAEVLKSALSDETPSKPSVQEILSAADRAADLTKQLLAFSRRQVMQPRTIKLSDAASESSAILQRLIGEHIQLVIRHDPALWNIQADPGQLTQVIMNLAVNARDAMPQGGTLSITTENRELSKSEAWRIGLSRPGQYVILRVRDTGCGMDRRTLSRVFEPFFTTKEKGKGTGLGLATVYGIVQQSGGHVAVTSVPGDGTEFCVYFPAFEESLASQPGLEAGAGAPVEAGHETILLVEDEDQVRRLLRSTLTQQGYEVIEASRESEAVAMAEGYKKAIHLLLTDVVLPEMTGKDLVQRLTSKRPELKVLYMSGYSEESILQRGMVRSEMPFLTKPFTPATLGRKVREILDSSPRALSA